MPKLKTAGERIGTAYFEFEVVENGETTEAVYVEIDDFDSIDEVVRENIADFDIAGPNSPTVEEWRNLVAALDRSTADIATELAQWLTEHLKDGRPIYLNGL